MDIFDLADSLGELWSRTIQARDVLDLSQPVAVMFLGIMGHVADFGLARSIVARVLDAVPPGSYLPLEDRSDTSAARVAAHERYARTGAVPYTLRSAAQIGEFFTGLDLPGSAGPGAAQPVAPTRSTEPPGPGGRIRRGRPQAVGHASVGEVRDRRAG